jgi:hypothetical protein
VAQTSIPLRCQRPPTSSSYARVWERRSLSILPDARLETSLSPAFGLAMSELVLDGTGKSVDIRAFRPNRFVENQPIKAKYEYVDD